MSKIKSIVDKLAARSKRKRLKLYSIDESTRKSLSGYSDQFYVINQRIVVFSFVIKAVDPPLGIYVGHGNTFDRAIFHKMSYRQDEKQRNLVVDSAIRFEQDVESTLFIKVDYSQESFVAELTNLPPREASMLSLRKQYKIQNAIMDQGHIGLPRLLANERPFISIILPIYQPDKRFLKPCLESIKNQQGNPHVEVIISVDGESNLDQACKQLLLNFLEEVEGQLILNKERQHIGKNLNSALSHANGDYCAFLDQDDMLHPAALRAVSASIIEHQADIIYTDEDKIDELGEAVTPIYKPDYSHYYMLSTNYINHLLVVSRHIGEKVGWFRAEVDGAQDHDLLMRLSIETQHIVHLPQVLYHWRIAPGSTAEKHDNKSYANDAGLNALKNYFKLLGQQKQTFKGKFPGCYRWQSDIVQTKRVSVFRKSEKSENEIIHAVQELIKNTDYKNWKLFQLLPSAFEPKLQEKFKDNAHIEFVISDDIDISFLDLNSIIDNEKSEIYGFLDEHTSPGSPDWITSMVDVLTDAQVGVVGSKIINANNRLQHAGQVVFQDGRTMNFMSGMNDAHPGYFRKDVIREVSAVGINGLFITSAWWSKINTEDTAIRKQISSLRLCLKAQEFGGSVLVNPGCLLHIPVTKSKEDTTQGTATNHDDFAQSADYLIKMPDPFYNPNLSTGSSSVMLAIFETEQ